MTAPRPAEDGRWRRRGLRILGSVLVGYGLTGIALFGIVLTALGPPIVAVGSLSTSLEQERQEVLDTLTRASDTITQTAAGVRGMDTSLDRAQSATNQASGLSSGMADNMHGLAQAMNVSVLGIQPLAGLAPSFEQSGASFETLGQDLDDIATALGDNRQSVQSVATSLDQLGVSIARLTTSIRTGPAFSLGADGSLAALRIATLAVLVWLSLAALGCVVAGIACWRLARRI